MKRCRLTAAAERDLDAIFLYGLETFGLARTERYLLDLEEALDHLCRFPESARLRSDLVPPVRAYPQVSHVIVYEIEDESLIVLRIRSARENWAADPLGNDP